jgi:hypothetical protein
VNTLLRAAADEVGLSGVLGGMTLVFLLCFVAWTLWAFLPSRRPAMEAASRLPFEDEP